MTFATFAKTRDRERSAYRTAKLLLRRRRNLAEGIPGGQARRAVNIKRAAVKVIGAGLGYGIDDPAGRASELGVIARSYDLELLNRTLRNCEGLIRAFAPAQTTKKRIVVIRAVDLHITIDAALSCQRNLSTDRINLGGRRRQYKILEAPSIDRQLADRGVVDVRRRLNLRGLDIGARANEDGSGHTLNAEINIGSDSRTHLYLIAGLREFAEALSLHVDRVFT